MINKFEKLYAKASTGKIKTYSVEVKIVDGIPTIFRSHGYIDGKIQVDEKPITEGKNIGKSNETSQLQQANLEAAAMWQKKHNGNYSILIPSDDIEKYFVRPMLAKDFKKDGHRIVWPAFAQPKLNGVRCIAIRRGDNISFTSRGGKSYDKTLQHLVKPLLEIMKDGDQFDGEIYIHGLPLQTIVSYVKKLRPESASLQYWVYDYAKEGVKFSDRREIIRSRFEHVLHSPAKCVVSCLVYDKTGAIKFHDGVVKSGFEGAILRNTKGLYRFDARSADLQKLKVFDEDEFLIIGGRTPKTGRMAGGCVFLCRTDDGKEFECVPKGTADLRKYYYDNLNDLIGKKLTIKYFGKSIDGIPLFPVGQVIRDFE
jgi:DNA ligase-1